MHHHNQTIADLEREQAPSAWAIVAGACLTLAALIVLMLLSQLIS
jgi:hypothetical protein